MLEFFLGGQDKDGILGQAWIIGTYSIYIWGIGLKPSFIYYSSLLELDPLLSKIFNAYSVKYLKRDPFNRV